MVGTVITVYNLAMHIKLTKARKLSFWELPKLALLLLAIFLVIRLIFLIIWPTGATVQHPPLGVLFGELPTIIYLTIFTVVVVRWMEIFHYTMKSAGAQIKAMRPLFIISNAVVYVVFFILVILFFTLDNNLPPVSRHMCFF